MAEIIAWGSVALDDLTFSPSCNVNPSDLSAPSVKPPESFCDKGFFHCETTNLCISWNKVCCK